MEWFGITVVNVSQPTQYKEPDLSWWYEHTAALHDRCVKQLHVLSVSAQLRPQAVRPPVGLSRARYAFVTPCFARSTGASGQRSLLNGASGNR